MRYTKSNFIFPKSNFTIQHTLPELCSDKKRRGGRLKNKAIPFRLARTCTFNATIFTTAALPLSPLSDTPPRLAASRTRRPVSALPHDTPMRKKAAPYRSRLKAENLISDYPRLRRAANANAASPRSAATPAGSGTVPKVTCSMLPFQPKSATALRRFSAAKYSSASTSDDMPVSEPAVMRS